MQILHCPSSNFCRGCCWSTGAGPTDAFHSSCATSFLRPAAFLLCTYGLVFSMASVLRLDTHWWNLMTERLGPNMNRENLHVLSHCLWQSLYETWYVAFYSVFYTSFPVMLLAFFEQVRQFEVRFFSSVFFHVLFKVFSRTLFRRMWVQKAAWNGRSYTSLVSDKSSPLLSNCPWHSCMPSTRPLFSSLSLAESSTTQLLTTRQWESLSLWQPCSPPLLRSGLHFSGILN